MSQPYSLELRKPYLLLIGEEDRSSYAKTAHGIVDWRRGDVLGQLRFTDTAVDLGLPDIGIAEAAARGAGSLVIGVAPVGGTVPDRWWITMIAAAEVGLDIVSGLHTRLEDNPALRAAAKSSGANLIDVRRPPENLPIATGRRRSGRRILTVGTDCALGKKYSALAVERSLNEVGINSTFRASGQTGIMIAGAGIPIDAVVSDFIAGAAETLSPDNDADHWDVIEGQGSLFHPAYAGVSLGLLHGSQPDGIVLCHDASRDQIIGWENFPIPDLREATELHERMARRTNPQARCIGICVNTSSLAKSARDDYLARLRERYQLPVADPMIDGCAEIAEFVLSKVN